MSEHFWILEVNDADERYAWRAVATARGGLDIIAYRTKKEAAPDLYENGRLYGKARLRKYVPEQSIAEKEGSDE